MKWQRQEFVGRRAELDALRRQSGKPALLVVRGREGSGKTALLGRLRTEANADVVLLDAAGPAWDEFRGRALLNAVREGFEDFGGGPRVAESIAAVSRLCVPESYATPGRRHRLLGAMGVLLSRIRTRLVILIDDADDVSVAALAPMHRAGHTVVAACGGGARELCSLADRVIDLEPLTDDEVGRLLWQVAGTPVDDAVPHALRKNLGPLYGNPGALVSTVESLVEQRRLAKVHGVLALRAPDAPIALAAGHRLLGEIDEIGRVLVRLAARGSGLRLDRIPALARQTGRTVHDFGRTADRLVHAGVLVHEDGRLRCRVRAIAAAVAEPEDQPEPAERPDLVAYRRVCRGYADGDWAGALSAARELELASDVDRCMLDTSRLLAAEICGWRGENRQASAWLDAAGEDTPRPGLRGWVATGLRDNDSDDALGYGWTWYTTHTARLEEPGAARLLIRLASIAVDTGESCRARTILREVQDRYGPESVTGLLVRGIVERDDQYVRAAGWGIRHQGTRFEFVFACQRLALLSDEPRPWLDEAYELACSIGAARLIGITKQTMAGRGVTVPARRVRQSDASDVDDRVVELVRLGKTNRQIALELGVSVKTVEKRLTRLFAKAGCRTRHGLAMSGLDGRQELIGA